MDFNKIKKKIFMSIIAGLVIFFALGFLSDFGKLSDSLSKFRLEYLPLILLLAPVNYLLRYVKWNYYLGLLGIKINRQDNIRVFLSGLGMTVTPGKLGEFIKSYLIKEINGTPMSTTFPLVVIERLTDGISVIILASIGALRFRYGLGVLAASMVLVALFILFVRVRPFAEMVTGILKKLPVFRKIGTQIDSFYNSSYELLGMKSLGFSVALGAISWSFEGIVIYLALRAFNMDISILSSLFIVSFATIVGAISMLPGGLFAAEGSIMGLLIMMGIPTEIASATTIITRFSTLWLGVAVGIGGIISIQKRLTNKRKT